MSEKTDQPELKVIPKPTISETPETPQTKEINIKDLIGQSLVVLANGVSDMEIVDSEKTTSFAKVMKTIKVVNYVMGFKTENAEIPLFILQKGTDTNVINITRL